MEVQSAGARDVSVPDPDQIALFLDVDGTLLDLAPTPDAVTIPARLLRDLAAAERRLDGALALVSGRPIRELDRLFAPLKLRACGVHGAEIRHAPDGATDPLVRATLPEAAWEDLQPILRAFPRSFAENKGASFAVHYRGGAAVAAPLERALEGLAARHPEHETRLVRGHRVIELQLAGFDKGRAIDAFMAQEPFASRRPVFISDDRMDRAAFDRALSLGGLAYSVGADVPGVSGVFADTQAVRDWLENLAR